MDLTGVKFAGPPDFLEFDDGGLQDQTDDGGAIEKRRQADKEKDIGGGPQRILMAFLGAALAASFFGAADEGEIIFAAEKWNSQPDVDRRATPARFFEGLLDRFYLLGRQRIDHPLGQTIKKFYQRIGLVGQLRHHHGNGFHGLVLHLHRILFKLCK